MEALEKQTIRRLKFRRQQPIGKYIVDFVCFEKRIVIEVDGGLHALQTEKDLEKDKWLNQQSLKVLRFWNSDVLTNINGVLDEIRKNYKITLSNPSRQGRGKGDQE